MQTVNDQCPTVPLLASTSAGLQRYMIDLFSFDPVIIAHELQGPVMIVQGDHDMQVRPHDADLLARALPQAHREDLAGATHTLKASVDGNPFATYTDRAGPLTQNSCLAS